MSKKLILVTLLALLLGPVVGLASSPYDRVAYWDGDYPTNWADAATTQNVRDGMEAAGYRIVNADELKEWMDGHIADGRLSVVVMCNDIFPDTVAETNTEDCTVRHYLNAGGKIVFYADIPFYNQGHADGTNTNWGDGGAVGILGFNSATAWDSNTQVSITEAGTTWGLTETWNSVRALAVDTWPNLTILAVNGQGDAGGWVAHYVPGDTFRGFVRIRDVGGMPNVEDLIRLAEYAENVEMATAPVPEIGMVDVPRDTVLSWTSGSTAATHDVYFGTSFEDVNAASRDNPLGVLVSESQSANTYDPEGLLEFGITYYWRIDEVNSAPDFTIFRGEVWEFTAEPFAYPVENIIATSNATSEVGAGPENTINGSGLNELDQHSTASADMFLGKPSGDDPIYLQYDFGQVYKLHELLVWNYNVQFELILGFGIKGVTVEYSTDGTEWTALGEVEFAQATAKADYAANTTVAFDGVAAQYVRLTVNSGYGVMGQFGLSEVRFLYVPAQAREPQPADGDTDVMVDTVLSWRAGREAVSHEVYLGTDPEALALADTIIDTSYAPGTLDLATTYYWKVDEVNEADAISIWEGSLWSFVTQEYLVVDDFESYNDEDNLIYETWVDGWVNETGSTVGYLEGPFAETTIVNSGGQSMPLFYDNTGVATSEADFELSQNWTTNSVKSLSLYFHGDPENSGGQLYLKINNTKVTYDGDAADIARPAWQVWNIDLSTVGNVSNVTSLTIGVEDAGASGVLYIDDIRLYPLTPEYIVPVEPDSAGLVALYTLDGNADDSSGNGNNGTLNGDVQFGAGVDGSALDCDGVDDYVSTGKSASDLGIGGNSPRTATVWVYTRSFANGGIYDVGARTTGQDFCLRTMATQDTWRIQYWGGDFDFTYDTANKWVHFAHVHDGARTKIYANGVLIVDWETTIDTMDTNPFQIGLYGWPDAYFNGLIDDLHLYNRALSAEEVLGAAGQTTPRHKPF